MAAAVVPPTRAARGAKGYRGYEIVVWWVLGRSQRDKMICTQFSNEELPKWAALSRSEGTPTSMTNVGRYRAPRSFQERAAVTTLPHCLNGGRIHMFPLFVSCDTLARSIVCTNVTRQSNLLQLAA